MYNANSKRVWVTGASSGLGLALVEHLLELGARVVASGRASEAPKGLAQQYSPRLRWLDSNLSEPLEALEVAKQINDRWGALDCLIINAGTCDYLPVDTPAPSIFEGIVSSNLSASSLCLESALPLLQHGRSPQVVGIISRYSSLQLYDPRQPATPGNSVMQLFNSQRAVLADQAIDLTIIAPPNLRFPLATEQAAPEQWTEQTAAKIIIKHLPGRSANLVLEALHLNSLWPLPK